MGEDYCHGELTAVSRMKCLMLVLYYMDIMV